MAIMFIELKETDSWIKNSLINEMAYAEYLYNGLDDNPISVNSILMHLRRYSEFYIDKVIDLKMKNKFSNSGFSNKFKIDRLFDSDIISQQVKNYLHTLRMDGNKGVHNKVSIGTSLLDPSNDILISKEDVLSLFVKCFELYNYYLKIFANTTPCNEHYCYNPEKVKSHYINNKNKILDSIHEEEKIELERIYNEKLREVENKLVVIEDSYKHIIDDKEKEIKELLLEKDKNIKLIKELYKDNALKMKVELKSLDIKYSIKTKNIENNYKHMLDEKDSEIVALKSLTKKLIIGIGVSVTGAITFLTAKFVKDKKKEIK